MNVDQNENIEVNEERNQSNQNNQNENDKADDDLNFGKGEKKIKKALLKVGLNKIEGVNRVTIRQKDNYFFVVKDPEVYVSKECESSYVIFGEISMDDTSSQQAPVVDTVPEKKPETVIVEEDPNEVVSEEGIDPESIEMVINEAKCSRQKAVKALKKNNGDVVNSILDLNN